MIQNPALATYTKAFSGPEPLDIALHAIGRERVLAFQLGNESPDNAQWIRDCKITLAQYFLNGDVIPRCSSGYPADMEITVTAPGDDIFYPELASFRLLWNLRHASGDVLEIRLRDGSVLHPADAQVAA